MHGFGCGALRGAAVVLGPADHRADGRGDQLALSPFGPGTSAARFGTDTATSFAIKHLCLVKD